MILRSRTGVLLLAWIVCRVLLPTFLYAEEAIEHFRTAISLDSDGSMLVSETIDVRSEGQSIVHGIFRKLPLLHWSDESDPQRSNISVLSVERDGHETPYEAEQQEDRLELKIMNPAVALEPGTHTFALRYRVTGRVNVHKPRQQLDWSVTGHWPYPIKGVDFNLSFPGTVSAAQVHFETFATSLNAGEDATPQVRSISSLPGVHGEIRETPEKIAILSIQDTETLKAGEALQVRVSWGSTASPSHTKE